MKKKYQRQQIKVECNSCGKIFTKDKSEVKRNKRLVRPNYCSRECFGKTNTEHLKNYRAYGNRGNTGDTYTIVREHLRRVKNRNKEIDITLDDLLDKWNEQKGVCPYTGIKLVPPRESDDVPLYMKASLDRIDSNIGYVKENIQFISASANLAKSNMTHLEMVKFCEIIKNNWS